MDVRIVNRNQNQGAITAATPEQLGNRGALPVVLVNASGDIYNALGAATGGDGAILDGADSGIKATVRNASGSVKPLHVIITNASGDMPNLAPPGGSDGAINDGVTSSTKASVLVGPTTRPSGTSNPLLVQFADDPTRQLGQTSPPVTGVQVLGGVVGARVQPSGDFPVQVGVITAPVGVTGDVSTTPKAGQTWPVSIAGTVNVAEQGKIGTHVSSGQVGVTGDVNVTATNLDIRDLVQSTDSVGAHQKGAWNVGISGDVSTTPKAGETWPVSISQTINTQQVGPVGSQIVGGAVGGIVSLSGDAMVSQRGGWSTAVSGDVLLRYNPNTIIGQIGNTVGVNVIGGSVGGRVSISGDTLLVNQQGAWAVAVTGDVSTRPLGGQTWPVSQQGAIGVNILGSQGSGTVGISGDAPVSQKGGWAVSVTGDVLTRAGSLSDPRGPIGVQIVGTSVGQYGVSGDVLLRANPDVVIGQIGNTLGINAIGGSFGGRVSISGDVLNTREQNVIGVQLVGGSGGGTVGVTGDVNVRPRGAYATAISGDGGVYASVRDYANSNPLAVVLTNNSGDTYNAGTKMPVLTTVSGRFANQGSNSVVSAVAGRKIKVTRYNLQGDGDNARGYFASGASGSQLTAEFELASREGVVEYVQQAAGGYLFATAAGSALSLEATSSKGIKYSVSYHTEDAL